ncbi:MAG TPA: FHA domain-containing protein [Nannocystis exedens]|nr:FHA domain-containing protein [Nannocystis exedens]
MQPQRAPSPHPTSIPSAGACPANETTLELRRTSRPTPMLLYVDGRPPISLVRGRSWLLGTSPTADLLLHDPTCSGRHARISWEGEGWIIEDLGSTNGTYVDGVRVRQAWLRAHTNLRLGRWRGRLLAANRADTSPEIAGMHGRSAAFRRLVDTLHRFGPLPTTVLLKGPTGSGKELAARALHQLSPRKQGPFIAVNCGALPEALCSSELFGHVRGAFTGALRGHDGAFLRARGGTLFLDEIGELSPQIQATLLRVLETRTVVPLGAEKEVSLDVRVIAATHRPLLRWIAEGRFREDLYHRLGVLTLELPALRERQDDIPLLIERFSATIENELSRPVVLTDEAIEAAVRYPWPGNIRQLRNALLRAAVTQDGPISAADLLPPVAAGAAMCSRESLAVPRGTYAQMTHSLLDQVIREAGSIRKAARVLGIPRSTLGAWMRRGNSRGGGHPRALSPIDDSPTINGCKCQHANIPRSQHAGQLSGDGIVELREACAINGCRSQNASQPR